MASENLKSPSTAEKLLTSGHWDKTELVEALLREYYPQVYQLAYAILEQHEAARQAAVRSFANALANVRRYRKEEGVCVWLYSHALPKIKKAERGRKTHNPTKPGSSSQEQIIGEWINSLGGKERALLILVYAIDCDVSQAARVIQVSEIAVRAQLSIFNEQFSTISSQIEASSGRPASPLTEGTGEKNQAPYWGALLAEVLKERWPTTQLGADELAGTISKVMKAAAEEEITRRQRAWALAVMGILGLVGISILCLFGGVFAWANRSEFFQSPTEWVSGMPTPVTPAPAARPLTKRANSPEIRQRLEESRDLWRTLWIDVQATHYGPQSYIGPAKTYHSQAWISQAVESIELYGILEIGPNSIYTVKNERLLMVNPLLDASLSEAWDGEIESLVNHPDLRAMVYPYSGAWGQQEGWFEAIGREKIAGRQTIIAEWSNTQGELKARLWIDALTGLILRWQSFESGDSQAIEFDAIVTEITFDQSAPPNKLNDELNREVNDPNPTQEGASGEPKILVPTATKALQQTRRPPLPTVSAPPALDPARAPLKFQFSNQPETANIQVNTADVPADVFADDYYLGKLEFGLPWVLRCARSPDGSRLAFNTGTDGTTLPDGSLRWFNLGDLSSIYQPLPDLQATFLAFSPDSRHLAVFGVTQEEQTSGVYLVDIATGEQRLLINLEQASSLVWSPDGEFLALTGKRSEDDEFRAMVIHVDAGQVIHTYALKLVESGAIPDWPVPAWGLDFPVEMGGMEQCAAAPDN